MSFSNTSISFILRRVPFYVKIQSEVIHFVIKVRHYRNIFPSLVEKVEIRIKYNLKKGSSNFTFLLSSERIVVEQGCLCYVPIP